MGKMACCSKAIFRWKWGLSESGLMAVGVVPAVLVASCRKTRLTTRFSTGNPPPVYSRPAGRARVLLPRLNWGVGRRKCRLCVVGETLRFCPDKFMPELNPTERRRAKVREPRCVCGGDLRTDLTELCKLSWTFPTWTSMRRVAAAGTVEAGDVSVDVSDLNIARVLGPGWSERGGPVCEPGLPLTVTRGRCVHAPF